jgi:hypothetical protein
LYDFECSKEPSHVFEEFADWKTPTPVKCPLCGELTEKRLIGATRIDPKLGLDRESFPTMADKWERTRRQRMQIETREARARGES